MTLFDDLFETAMSFMGKFTLKYARFRKVFDLNSISVRKSQSICPIHTAFQPSRPEF